MISKTAFVVVYMLGVIWFALAAVYTYKTVFKDFTELFLPEKR